MKRRPGIKTLLKAAIARGEETIESYNGETNPQIVELRNRAIGSTEAYRDVLNFLNGSRFELELAANGAGPVLD